MRVRVRRHSEVGAALTEFAVVVPLLVSTFFASGVLIDIGLLRIKAQEVARFSVWSFTQQPLSDHGSQNPRHARYFEVARARVNQAVRRVYPDFDRVGAGAPFAGSLVLRQERAPVLPRVARLELPWSSRLPRLLFDAVGLATSTDDFAARFYERVGMNGKGLVTSNSTLSYLPPASKARGNPSAVSAALVVDSWRSVSGHAALPIGPRHSIARVVERFVENATRVLPGAGLLGGYANTVGAGSAGAYVLSKPYLSARPCHARSRTGSTELSGQVNPFRLAQVQSSQLQEPDAVTRFETLPLYDRPHAESENTCSEMAEVLNQRGPNFMGCGAAQQRRCQ